jgi:predicted Zn-ribbon and HTH transcriptional regulator
MSKPSPGREPKARNMTVRQAIRDVLLDDSLTALEISERVGVREREVTDHLEHLQRSLARGEGRLVVDPALCLQCGFAFRKRERLSRPGRCPRCGGGRIQPPRFARARR